MTYRRFINGEETKCLPIENPHWQRAVLKQEGLLLKLALRVSDLDDHGIKDAGKLAQLVGVAKVQRCANNFHC